MLGQAAGKIDPMCIPFSVCGRPAGPNAHRLPNANMRTAPRMCVKAKGVGTRTDAHAKPDVATQAVASGSSCHGDGHPLVSGSI